MYIVCIYTVHIFFVGTCIHIHITMNNIHISHYTIYARSAVDLNLIFSLLRYHLRWFENLHHSHACLFCGSLELHVYYYVQAFTMHALRNMSISPYKYARVIAEGDTLKWWRHQMETISALLALCDYNSPVTGEFPTQRPVTRSFGVSFDLCLNKLLSRPT